MGGGIYDAVIAACAEKAGAEWLCTWNLKHFIRLNPAIAIRVRSPEWQQ
jgi:predicted nucleic acid-binding protein